MLPGQGGTNGKVVSDMYKTLNVEGKQRFLKVYWYTAKDQEIPIDAAEKRRNCHGKLSSANFLVYTNDLCASQSNSVLLMTRSPFKAMVIKVPAISPVHC